MAKKIMILKDQKKSLILLVGMENILSTLQCSLSVSVKTKNKFTVQTSNCPPGHLPQRNKTYVHEETAHECS